MSTILLADDSLTIQKVVELTFADTEHTVVAVSGGDELLQKLSQVRPDLIICDVIMPGRDGYDVCQHVKSEPSTLHIPVILLTGTFEPFDRDRALAAGCSEIVTKPFEARKLVETVEKLLPSAPAPQPLADTGPIEQPERFDGELTPPPDASPPQDQPAEEFGTRVASQADEMATASTDEEEALEFTSTGFDEMEAAGEAQQEAALEPPEGALEFDQEELEAEDLPADEPPETELAEDEEESPAEEPFASPPGPEPVEEEAHAAGEEAAAEPFAESPESAPPTPAEAEPAAQPFAEPAQEMISPPDGPAETDEPPAAPTPPATDDEMATMTTQPGVALPPEAMPEPPPAEPAEPPPAEEQLEEATEPPVEAGTPAPSPLSAEVAALSDEDVDRIARRVLELARDTFEKIAWDVVPDMAEIVVRERVRELEAEVEGDAGGPN